MIGYFSEEELQKMGFKSIGRDIKISKTSTLYNCHNISIGNNVRIDNFSTIAFGNEATLTIGNYVHLSAYNFLNGSEDLIIEDYVTTAPYVRIFTSSDDYSGAFMTGGVLPKEMIGTVSKKVILKKHVIIGVGSTILPGISLGMGTSVGGHSMVKHSSDDFDIIAGVPAVKIGERKRDFIKLARDIHE